MARPHAVALPSVRVAEYTVVTNVFAFLAVAVLSGSLAEGLRRADHRLAEASSAIADLKAINQHIIDSLTSGLATTDQAGRLLTFNRAAEVITGVSAAAVVGRTAVEVLQLPQEFGALLARDQGRRTSRVDYTYHAKGVPRDIGLSATDLVTADGREGSLLTFQDVTDLRRLERDARRKQRLAAVGEMAAGIAHEIRNPLASLRGSIQVLRQELTLSDEQAQLMDIVLRESERLNDTISSFLSYARPQRRQTTRFEVGKVLRETAILLRNSSEVRDDHAIEVSVAPDEVMYVADEHQLRQIVWNLATNGLRAMPNGGRLLLAVSLEPLTAAADGGDLVLSVSDEGVGIPAEDLDGIFQPFHGDVRAGQRPGPGHRAPHRERPRWRDSGGVDRRTWDLGARSAPAQDGSRSGRMRQRRASGQLARTSGQRRKTACRHSVRGSTRLVPGASSNPQKRRYDRSSPRSACSPWPPASGPQHSRS